METTFAVGDSVVVVSVDMYGFCGRENHPTEDDIGVTGTVVKAKLIDGRVTEEDEPCSFCVLTVITHEPQGGRVLDLMDFEVKHDVSRLSS